MILLITQAKIYHRYCENNSKAYADATFQWTGLLRISSVKRVSNVTWDSLLVWEHRVSEAMGPNGAACVYP